MKINIEGAKLLSDSGNDRQLMQSSAALPFPSGGRITIRLMTHRE